MSGKRRAQPRRIDARSPSRPPTRPGGGKPGSGGKPASGGAQGAARASRGGKGAAGRTIEPVRRSWLSPGILGWGSGALVVVVVLVLVLVNVTGGGKPSALREPVTVPASLVEQVTHVPASVLDQVGTGGNAISSTPLANAANPIKTAHATGNGLPAVNGKPVVFYFGALWCPICATERWAMIVALSRFGTFSGLKGAESAQNDSYPNTQTWDFASATYTSKYIVFTPDEFQDMNRDNLTPITQAEAGVLNVWDPPTKFPFLTIGNKYVAGIPGWLDPQLLQGLSRSQIAETLTQPTNPLGSAVDADANYLTAAICSVDGMQPSSVCSSSGVTKALAQLKKAPAAVPFS
jgi:thiol-disulfide isomerase/thioredoxin